MTVRLCAGGDGRAGQDGYATVAAVAAIVVFALLAMVLQASGHGSLAMADAEVSRARASAAADAGLALALAGLLSDDPAGHWSPDGRARQLDFAGGRLAIQVEDERGKVPISLLDEAQAEHLLQLAGLQGDRLRIARDSLLDWSDDDDDARTDGAESQYYAPRHISPRNGVLQSIDELALVRGFDPALLAKLRPIVTIDWAGGPFESQYASPEALAVMTDQDADSPSGIARRRELAGQVTALGFSGAESLTGHILRVNVRGQEPGGGVATRSWVVQITGTGAQPYVIRSME